MSLNVDLVSKEVLKPSSPTPPHLKTFKLSLIDQLSPAMSVPIVLFYQSNQQVQDPNSLHRLKRSLSQTLTYFYPLAGRITDNGSINCNDEGIEFLEAQVKSNLSEILSLPTAEHIFQLFPEENSFGMGEKGLLLVRANMFECGGMALGICMSHKIVDACSLCLFLNTWAAISKDEHEIVVPPRLDMSSLFPPRDILSSSPITPAKLQNNIVTKRFVFDASNITTLLAKFSDSSYVESPTRLEAVVALMWKCGMNAVSRDGNSASVCHLPVNLRKRMDPPLSNLWLGNFWSPAWVTSRPERQEEMHCLMGKLRKVIRKMDREYVKKFQATDDGFSEFLNSFKELVLAKAKDEVLTFTSWCRFPFYETDFGWGKPVWARVLNTSNRNLIVLTDTRCGQGLEAWVSLDQEDMARFELQPELRAFTSTNLTI